MDRWLQMRRRLAALAGERNRWAERIAAEIEFAHGLAELHRDLAADWPARIDQAWAAVSEALDAGRGDDLPAAVRRAEEALAPLAETAKSYTVHCVGHGHIDMNWMWSWPETVAATNDTFTTVLKLMEEFDDFCYTQSQISVYEIMRRYHPRRFEEIRRRVAQGRWEVAAASWVEGDKNLPSGESLARHLLLSRRWLAEQFGLAPEDQPLQWEPDTFGHAATIPSIVSRGAVRWYYFGRGGSFHKPPAFWWAGLDGRRVLVSRETTWYNDHVGPHNIRALLAFAAATGLRDWMLVYGVGDHGGGPTRRDILKAREMDAWPIWPNFRSATTRRYFEALQRRGDDLPVLTGEMNFEFTGCYTTQTRIKRANRLAEAYLPQAEAAACLAWRALGDDYPADALRQAWTDTLLGHFHDILPGSGVRETREYQMGLFQQVAAATGAIRTAALRGLAAEVDTSFAAPLVQPPSPDSAAMGAGAGWGSGWDGFSGCAHAVDGPRPVVVFNPTAWPRSELVKATVWDAAGEGVDLNDQTFVVRAPDGRRLPAQRLRAGSYWEHRYVELAFPVTVGPLGYAACAIEPAGETFAPPSHGYARRTVGDEVAATWQAGARFAGELTMENEHLAVEIDARTAGLVKLVDKAAERNVARPDEPLGLLEYVLERPRGMSAWAIGDLQRCDCPLEVTSLKRVEAGPHLVAAAAEVVWAESRATVTWSLAAGSRHVDCRIEVDWFQRGGGATGTPGLRMRFPLAVEGAGGRYEIPFGSIRRDLCRGEEVPARRWADVTGAEPGTGRPAGCTLLNDCKHGHSLDGGTLRLTLIRASYEPDPLPEIGRHEVRLALAPHGEPPSAARLVRMAAGLDQPLAVVNAEVHAGRLPPAAHAATCEAEGVILSAVKKAEDDDALVFRLYETAGRDEVATVVLNEALLGRPAEAVETDLLERVLGDSTAEATDSGFRVRVPACGIVTVKVSPQPCRR